MEPRYQTSDVETVLARRIAIEDTALALVARSLRWDDELPLSRRHDEAQGELCERDRRSPHNCIDCRSVMP